MRSVRDILGSDTGSLAFSESLALKAVSLLLALILWITILGFKREETKVSIPLQPLVPPGKIITNKLPAAIQFTLSGPRVQLKDFERSIVEKAQKIHPDLRHTRDTTVVLSVTDDLVENLPNGVRVVGFSPPTILVRLEDIVERYVPVKPKIDGQPAPGEQISVLHVTPSKVGVSGPKGTLEMLDAIETNPINITNLKGTKEEIVEFDNDALREQGLRLSRDKVVKVRVTTKHVREE